MAEVVKSYKTLEYFSLPGYFRLPRDLTTRAKVGIGQIVKTIWNTQDYTPELALKLFDSQISHCWHTESKLQLYLLLH